MYRVDNGYCLYSIKVYSLGGGHISDDRSVGFSRRKDFVNA